MPYTCFFPVSSVSNSTKEVKRSKRSIENDNTFNEIVSNQSPEEVKAINTVDEAVKKIVGSNTCRMEAWKCVSGIMEKGVKFLDKPGGLWR